MPLLKDMTEEDFDAAHNAHFPGARFRNLHRVSLGDEFEPPQPMLFAPLRGVLSGSPACVSECQQGRKPCPTPDACRLPEADDQSIPPTPREIFSIVVRPALLVLLGIPAGVIGLGLIVSFVRGLWP